MSVEEKAFNTAICLQVTWIFRRALSQRDEQNQGTEISQLESVRLDLLQFVEAVRADPASIQGGTCAKVLIFTDM